MEAVLLTIAAMGSSENPRGAALILALPLFMRATVRGTGERVLGDALRAFALATARSLAASQALRALSGPSRHLCPSRGVWGEGRSCLAGKSRVGRAD